MGYDFGCASALYDENIHPRVMLGPEDLERLRRRACPGGFVEGGEDLPEAAARELMEETGLSPLVMAQIGAWGMPGRDPRGRVISAVYLAVAGREGSHVRGGDDARRAGWHSLDELPALAFDHADLISAGLRALRRLCERTQLVMAFLPELFVVDDLESVLGGLGALDSRVASVRIIGAAPQVRREEGGGRFRMEGVEYLARLSEPVFIFPGDIT